MRLKIFNFGQLLVELAVIALVIVSYVYLFRTAFTIQQQYWTALLPRVFSHIVQPQDSYCSTSLPVLNFKLSSTTQGECQLTQQDFSSFTEFLGVGYGMSASEIGLLFQALDCNRNGLISWNELMYDFQGDGVPALYNYIGRWRQTKDSFIPFIPEHGLHPLNATC